MHRILNGEAILLNQGGFSEFKFFFSVQKNDICKIQLGIAFLNKFNCFPFSLTNLLRYGFSADLACYGGSRIFTNDIIIHDAIRGEVCSAQSSCGFATFNYTSNSDQGM